MARELNGGWMVGEIRDEAGPVLIRHRLRPRLAPAPRRQWLVVLTHHLTTVQADGLPEAGYNDSLQALDSAIIRALETGKDDQVLLVETCHGKRHYYAYVQSIDPVGKSVQRVIERNPGQTLSYRTALDPDWRFALRYLELLPSSAFPQ